MALSLPTIMHLAAQQAVQYVRSGSAAEFAQQYLNLQAPVFEFSEDGGERYVQRAAVRHTPVDQYLNDRFINRAGLTALERKRFKDYLLTDFLSANVGIRKHVSGITIHGSKITIKGRGGITLYNWNKVAIGGNAFYGKGSPDDVRQAVQLISLWKSYMELIRGKDSKDLKVKVQVKKDGREETVVYTKKYEVQTLPVLVSMFLGVDCNGFTGHYLRSTFPQLKVQSTTTEETYRNKAERWDRKHKTATSTKLRQAVGEIQENDVVVFYSAKKRKDSTRVVGHHHVAMVNRVLWSNEKEAQVSLAEARSVDHGGVQVNSWRIKPATERLSGDVRQGKFRILNGDGYDRESPGYVEIVDPTSLQ